MTSGSAGRAARCLLVQYTAEYGGSPISGLAVVDALRGRGLAVDVVIGVRGPLEQRYRERGCGIHYVRHAQWLGGGTRWRRLRRWGREAQTTWLFLALYRQLRPRLVYVNTLVSLAAVLAARLYGVPVIWHVRELFEDAGGEMRPPLGGLPLARALVRRLPTLVICVSKSVQSNVLGTGPCSKARVIYNPLPIDGFEPGAPAGEARRRLGLPPDAFMVGLPGTLRPAKGHEFFVEAAALLVREDSSWHFAISGDHGNAFAERVRHRCAALGIAANVHFVGALADMRGFYAACDVACVPSRAEPFGRTVIEAFAQRRPVVAARTGGIPESVVDGETGLLVEFGDVPALAEACRRLRGDAALRARVADAGWRSAVERFHIDRFSRELVDSIATVLAT